MKVLSPNSPLVSELPVKLVEDFAAVSIMDLAHFQSPPPGPLLVLATGLEPRAVVEEILIKDISNIIQKNAGHMEEDITVSSRLLDSPDNFFAQPAACLLGNVQSTSEILFSSPSHKESLRTQCFDFIAGEATQNVRESLEVILEELYMNAIIDAPAEAKKSSHAFDHYGRGASAKISLAKNESRLAIACSDPFGSLDINKFLKRLHEVLKQGAGNVMNFREEGGAGIGCSLIIEHCMSLYLGVISQKMTVVSCVIPLGLSYRQRAKLQKSLHLIRN